MVNNNLRTRRQESNQGSNRDSSNKLGNNKSKVIKPQVITEPQLCQENFYEKCPSSAITDTVFTAGVTGFNFWEANESSLDGSKLFSSGRVELKIRDRFDIEDFAEITYQAKEVIAHQFGEKTLKMHYALAAHAFRQPNARKEELKVSASKLLIDFGEETKNRSYISKQERGKDDYSTQYLSKEEKLKEIAHHAYLLKRLEVCVREWKIWGDKRKRRVISIQLSNLWDISGIEKTTQPNPDGTKTVTDVIITYRPGLWYEKFANREYLHEFGYITSEALKLDPYREKMALRIAYFALFGLQQHKTGRYKVKTLLGRVGYEKEIESAKNDRVSALHLKRSFDRGLKILSQFQYPYKFLYDSDIPEWTNPNSKLRKPKGWFELWLECTGILIQPDLLPKRSINSSHKQIVPSLPMQSSIPNLLEDVELENDSSTSATATTKKRKSKFDRQITGEEIKAARQIKDHSIRVAANLIGISPGLLSRLENNSYPYMLQNSIKLKLFTYLDF
jgi:hypothetical protein